MIDPLSCCTGRARPAHVNLSMCAHPLLLVKSMRRLSVLCRDADELMLVEAIQASLQLQAEKQHGSPSASTADAVTSPAQHNPRQSYDPYASPSGSAADAHVYRTSGMSRPPGSSPFAAAPEPREAAGNVLGLSRNYHPGAGDSAHSTPLRHRQDGYSGGVSRHSDQ